MWGGRFSAQMDELMERFNASFGFDRRLYAADVRGSIAYAAALAKADLISETEAGQLITGLQQVNQEFEDGVFVPQPGDEDIHTAVNASGSWDGAVAGKRTPDHPQRSGANDCLYLLQKVDLLTRCCAICSSSAGQGKSTCTF